MRGNDGNMGNQGWNDGNAGNRDEMVEMKGIKVRIRGTRAGIWGIGMGIRAIVVEMQGTWERNERNQGENLCIEVELMN